MQKPTDEEILQNMKSQVNTWREQGYSDRSNRASLKNAYKPEHHHLIDRVFKSPLDLGKELLKTYDQDLLDKQYASFISNHPEIVRNGLEDVGKHGHKGWNEKYMSEVMDKEFLKNIGHKGDVWDFEEANPNAKVLYARLRALENWEDK